MAYYRNKVVNIIRSWVGKNESDGSFRSIIDSYNSIKPLPVGYKVSYNDEWCASTYSAVFHEAGYDAICPSECSCNRMIDKAKSMGIWVENDAYIPNIGDAVIYDWQDNGAGDNMGFPDHIGMVVSVGNGKINVIEGNNGGAVRERSIDVNGRYIRGFVTPKFTATSETVAPTVTPTVSESTSIKVGDVVKVKNAITYEGKSFKTYVEKYDVIEVKGDRVVIGVGTTVVASINAKNLEKVGSIVTPQAPTTQAPTTFKNDSASKFDKAFSRKYTCTDALNLRTGAGTNKQIIVTMPSGTEVMCYGYYTPVGTANWLYVNAIIKGVKYTGFCSSEYLR